MAATTTAPCAQRCAMPRTWLLRGSRPSARPSAHTLRAVASESLGVRDEDYITLGVSHCFSRNEDEGKLQDVFQIEPINASSLECMANGAPTSFKAVVSMRVEDALRRNRDALPEEFQSAGFCDDYEFRLGAAARTWQRPHALDNLMDIVPLGKVNKSFNYDTGLKRILNMAVEVNDDDNIKQDMSIDVYNREKKEEYAEEKEDADESADDAGVDSLLDDDDDDIDDLLAL